MSKPSSRGPSWATSSFGQPADTSPGELLTLGEHVSRCRGKHGHWVTLRCGAERLAAIADRRPISTVTFAMLLLWLAARWA